MSELLDRLNKERTELRTRVVRLTAFVKTPAFSSLEPHMQELLREQLVHMRNYLRVLATRIALLDPQSRGTDNGETDNQDAQETAEGGLRITGKPEVSDAGQEPCGEREGTSEPAGEEGQPFQVSGSTDRREGEQGSGQKTQAEVIKGAWIAWYGSGEITRDGLVRKLRIYFSELGVILHEVIKASERNRVFEVYPNKSPAHIFGGKNSFRVLTDESWAALFAEAEAEERKLREYVQSRCQAISNATHKPYSVQFPYPPISGEL